MVSYGAVEEIYSRAKRATYWQQTAILVAENVCAAVTLNTELGADEVPDAFKPIPPGTYKILVPPSPRDKTMTAVYRSRMDSSLKSDQVWFPIEYGDNSRFIHLGDVSEGSVTVMELSRWNAIYQSLVSHRSTDGRYVGQLTVQK